MTEKVKVREGSEEEKRILEERGLRFLPADEVERIPPPEGWEPEDDWPEGHYRHGSDWTRCPEWNYRKGRQCYNMVATKSGNGSACASHGGKTETGIGNPNYKHGKTARREAMPGGLLAKYDRAMADPAYLRLRENIALLTAREEELFEALRDGGTGSEMITALGKHMDGMAKAQAKASRSADPKARAKAAGDAAEHMNKMKAIIEQARHDAAVWDDLMRIGEQKRRYIESERRFMIDAQLVVNIERVMAELDDFMRVVVEVVEERHALVAIQQAWRAMALFHGEEVPEGVDMRYLDGRLIEHE